MDETISTEKFGVWSLEFGVWSLKFGMFLVSLSAAVQAKTDGYLRPMMTNRNKLYKFFIAGLPFLLPAPCFLLFLNPQVALHPFHPLTSSKPLPSDLLWSQWIFPRSRVEWVTAGYTCGR